MRTKVLNVLAAVALFGAVAVAARAEEAHWLVSKGGKGGGEVVRKFCWGEVEIDKTYASAHPQQVGLQGVVADVRESVSNHETRISRLEGRVGALEERVGALEGGRTPATTTPPSGGTTSSGAETPQKGDSSMSPWGILGMIAVGVLTLAVIIFISSLAFGWLGTWIRALRNAGRADELAAVDNANAAAIGRIAPARAGRTFPAVPPPLGPTAGRGAQYYYDAEGRVVGWEEVQYPAPAPPAPTPAPAPAPPAAPGQAGQPAPPPTP